VTPPGLDEFRALLAGAGIDNVLLAERLEVDELVAAEAGRDVADLGEKERCLSPADARSSVWLLDRRR
jgi:hypothetical protein